MGRAEEAGGREGSVPLRVVVVDDHELVRSSLRAALADTPDLEVVAEAENGRRAIDLIAAIEPELATVDLSMPDGDGWAVLEAARSTGSSTRILVLSAYEDAEIVERTLELGAAAFASKRTPASELIRLLRTAGKGQFAVSADLQHKLVSRVGGGDSKLSGRELEVLAALAKGHTATHIASDLNLSEATVRTHLGAVKRKLGVANAAAAAAEGVRRGLID